MVEDDVALRRLARARWRRALLLTLVMLAVYFGFIALTALDKPFMGTQLTPGLSYGILFGALVIVLAFGLTGIYVGWANAHYDPELAEIRQRAARGRGEAA